MISLVCAAEKKITAYRFGKNKGGKIMSGFSHAPTIPSNAASHADKTIISSIIKASLRRVPVYDSVLPR